MNEHAYVAVDLGAGSGRVLLGQFTKEELHLEELHRFEQPVVHEDGHERWHLDGILAEVLTGLRAATRSSSTIRSIGVDSWAVDYGLLNEDDKLLANSVCYRDPRTDGVLDELLRRLPANEIYRHTGIQFLPFNTSVQLLSQVAAGKWPQAARRLLMIPDLLNQQLCGVACGELTNASSTQLLDVHDRTWNKAMLAAVGVDASVMPNLVEAGTCLGPLLQEHQDATGLGPVDIVAPATHDTASAVLGTPLQPNRAFLSSGTWSLLGVERATPIVNEDARRHNFTNEGGAFGTTRFLKNVMGLWLLESCRTIWEQQGAATTHAELTANLDPHNPGATFLQPDAEEFLHPANMVEAILRHLTASGQEPPAGGDHQAFARIILESLALRYAEVTQLLEQITGTTIEAIHIVGGGSQNNFLNQATANATGKPVHTGPIEATAIGNLLIQAITDQRFNDLTEAREFLRTTQRLRTFAPTAVVAARNRWHAARTRFARLGHSS